ncbi:MAG TPA: septal ring lytic transglycosylase RlpA family protein [Candidatus Acidoferrales bacterium]|nr:septal ring lytic transglycosylase RlpA family protein [Candidatus Acidoferrales bacterium]
MTRLTRSRKVRCCLIGAVIALATSTAYAGIPRSATSSKKPWKIVTRASWYGRRFSGRSTASGTNFNPQHLTAAHRTLELGSKVRVTELSSGRSVVVQITDRGPYVAGRGIDLSYAAARQLGILQRGVARVQVELIKPQKPVAAPIIVAASGASVPWIPRALVE